MFQTGTEWGNNLIRVKTSPRNSAFIFLVPVSHVERKWIQIKNQIFFILEKENSEFEEIKMLIIYFFYEIKSSVSLS